MSEFREIILCKYGELILKDTIADGCETCQLHYIKNHLKNA